MFSRIFGLGLALVSLALIAALWDAAVSSQPIVSLNLGLPGFLLVLAAALPALLYGVHLFTAPPAATTGWLARRPTR
jgi:hypothetical protein